MLNLTTSSVCPGLFYGVSARDGMLARLRIPGGLVNANQWDLLAEIADKYGAGYIQVTNRANLQIREINRDIPMEDLGRLQALGIGAAIVELDALRNIMASPTAGIDPQGLMDTRSLVQDIDTYLQSDRQLRFISPKFSIGLDGGEAVSICDRHNDILWVARQSVAENSNRKNNYFQLYLDRQPTHVCVTPEQVLAVVAALAQVYAQYCQAHSHANQRRPRLRQVFASWGMDGYLHRVASKLDFPLTDISSLELTPHSHGDKYCNYRHIGIHPQIQTGLAYIGLVLPLGKLQTWQMRGLNAIARLYGNGTLRLTPWQGVIIPHLPLAIIAEIEQRLQQLELEANLTSPWQGLIACSGSQGCMSSYVDTHNQAEILARSLPHLDPPLKIHISGCEKGCARQGHSDITLVGIGENRYQVFIGKSIPENPQTSFGRQLYTNLSSEQIQPIVNQIVQIFQNRQKPRETFQEFINRHPIEELRQLVLDQLKKTGGRWDREAGEARGAGGARGTGGEKDFCFSNYPPKLGCQTTSREEISSKQIDKSI